ARPPHDDASRVDSVAERRTDPRHARYARAWSLGSRQRRFDCVRRCRVAGTVLPVSRLPAWFRTGLCGAGGADGWFARSRTLEFVRQIAARACVRGAQERSESPRRGAQGLAQKKQELSRAEEIP